MSYDPTQRPSGPGDPNQSPPPPYGTPLPPTQYGGPQPPPSSPYEGSQPPPPNPYGSPQPPPPNLYGGSQPPPPSPYGVPPVPSYGAPPLPAYGAAPQMPPQPQKKSNRTLWIVLSIIGGVLVLACGVCAFAVWGLGMFIAQPTTVVSSYYDAIKVQDYNKAYTYLRIDTFTLGGQQIPATAEGFTQIGAAVDQENGPVTEYTVSSVNVVNDQADITVNVTRNGVSEPTHLRLQKFGEDWKIIAFDNL